MTLATHIIIAAAVTKPILQSHPITSAIIAIASHFLSDAIPHWDYQLHSMQDPDDYQDRRLEFTQKTIFRDFFWLSIDGFLGAGIVLFLLRPATLSEALFTLIPIIGGALPDFLAGIYATRRAEFLAPIQRFHDWIHTKIKLGPYPLIGIPFQIIIAGIALWFLF